MFKRALHSSRQRLRELPKSLRGRLVLVTAAFLFLFLVLAAFALERAFFTSLRAEQRSRLEAQLYALLTVADEIQPGKIRLPDYLRDDRFNQIDSGIYGYVSDQMGRILWRSASALSRPAPRFKAGDLGRVRFISWQQRSEDLVGASYDVIWEGIGRQESRYTFSVLESNAAFDRTTAIFRQTLWGGFAVVAFMLLAGLVYVMRWGLRPVREVARAVRAIEAGHAERLEGEFPRELKPLTDNINLFIESERERRVRYAETMANLAHSLKTPLAVLQGATDSASDELLRNLVREQVERMHGIVRYQLQRAVTKGRTPFTSLITVTQPLQQLADALRKVYAGKAIQIDLEISGSPRFAGEAGDLLEVLGNVMDNACKFASRQVQTQIEERRDDRGGWWLQLRIGDDGPGIAPAKREAVLSRGGRLDTHVEGQGIGLAVVAEIVEAYGGQLAIGKSPLGGAEFLIQLPIG
jgi:two-component system, OmpR family, sensor histidine kinase PhoQ